jgi:3-hydroxyisobutyrate dehydrogenase-like beta-hydroxyacid dehydrogenase
MGFELCSRLLNAGTDVWVYNRTRSKAEPLADLGAKVVDKPIELAGCDIVFIIVSGPKDVISVTTGPDGVLTDESNKPSVLVDITTIDPDTSAHVRRQAADLGVDLIAAPVSGNPKVVKSGQLTIVASGPQAAYDKARPLIEHLGKKVTYVGDADQARLVKICHNLMLGIVAQTMAETSVLVEKAGVSRADYLEFLNESVMGSVFTRYKSPAYVNLDYTPTFTWDLLRKDFELGLSAGRDLDVPLPVSALVHQIVIDGMGLGYTEQDFAALLTKAARGAGYEPVSENREVDDGLG